MLKMKLSVPETRAQAQRSFGVGKVEAVCNFRAWCPKCLWSLVPRIDNPHSSFHWRIVDFVYPVQFRRIHLAINPI
jgi:hypothetical protein